MNIAEAVKCQELANCGYKKTALDATNAKNRIHMNCDNAVVYAQISIKAILTRRGVCVNFEHLVLMFFQKEHKICHRMLYKTAIF